MKQCKDCKWQNKLVIEGYTSCPFRKICIGHDRTIYRRKWWKLWAPKLILLAVLLGGCSKRTIILEDGTEVHSIRLLDSTEIGHVSYDGGSFVLEGYKSDMSIALTIIDKLVARDKELRRELAALGWEVKP